MNRPEPIAPIALANLSDEQLLRKARDLEYWLLGQSDALQSGPIAHRCDVVREIVFRYQSTDSYKDGARKRAATIRDIAEKAHFNHVGEPDHQASECPSCRIIAVLDGKA